MENSAEEILDQHRRSAARVREFVSGFAAGAFTLAIVLVVIR